MDRVYLPLFSLSSFYMIYYIFYMNSFLLVVMIGENQRLGFCYRSWFDLSQE